MLKETKDTTPFRQYVMNKELPDIEENADLKPGPCFPTAWAGTAATSAPTGGRAGGRAAGADIVGTRVPVQCGDTWQCPPMQGRVTSSRPPRPAWPAGAGRVATARGGHPRTARTRSLGTWRSTERMQDCKLVSTVRLRTSFVYAVSGLKRVSYALLLPIV